MTTHADKRQIETGCLALRHGMRTTAVRRFHGHMTVSPEAEHQAGRLSLQQETEHVEPYPGASRLCEPVGDGDTHAVCCFSSLFDCVSLDLWGV